MVERWLAFGPPLVGAGETLAVSLGGMDVPMKFIHEKSILECMGLYDLIVKPFNALLPKSGNYI
jgi:hypothetical protein